MQSSDSCIIQLTYMYIIVILLWSCSYSFEALSRQRLVVVGTESQLEIPSYNGLVKPVDRTYNPNATQAHRLSYIELGIQNEGLPGNMHSYM